MNIPPRQDLMILTVPFLLVAFLVLTTGVEPLPSMGVFDGKRVLVTALWVVLIAVALLNERLKAQIAAIWSSAPVWALLCIGSAPILAVISALRFEHPGYGLADVAMLLLIVTGLVITASVRRLSPHWFDRIAILGILSAGLIAVFTEAVGLAATLAADIEYRYSTMLVRFAHPRFYNQLQSFSIPLLAALPFIMGNTRKWKVIAVLAIAAQWALLLVSGGRGSWVSLAVAFSLAFLLFPGGRSRWLALHIAGLALGAALYLGVMELNTRENVAEGEFVSQSVGRPMLHTTGRTELWKHSIRGLQENPWLGTGPARFSCGLPTTWAAHPHNAVMRLAGEWGMPAFLMLLSFGMWLGWTLIRNGRSLTAHRNDSAVVVAMLCCSVTAGAVHAMVSGVLIMPAGQVMTMLVGGWAMGVLIQGETTRERMGSTAAMLCMMVVAISTLVFATTEQSQLEQRTADPDAQHTAEPRFWHQGHSCYYQYTTD